MNEYYNKLRYFEDDEKIPSEIYYHYTSLEALFGIVTSKSFRLTSLKSSNDKKELYYKPDEFLADFSFICNNEEDKEKKENLKLIEVSIETNKDDFFCELKRKSFPYALCLSEKKDNLTHWDRYALGCTGVSIGFNVSSLKVQMQRTGVTASVGVGLYDIERVVYSSIEKKESIRNDVTYLLNTLLKNKPERKLEILQSDGYKYAVAVCSRLMRFSKNSSFVDEDEIRFYFDSNSIKDTLYLIDLIKEDLGQNLHKKLRQHFLDLVNQLHLEKDNFYV